MSDGYVRNALVAHATLGRGRVVVDEGEVVVVRFESGIASCPRDELERLQDLAAETAMQAGQPLRVLTRALGAAISSVNDTWGVFSNSRIDLLPHQLWVCRKVLERWPTRWLVADDVGLGKTVEAGLVLTPLLASGRVQRLLVLAPASLVDQWQQRMREMFDIRLARYTGEADKPGYDFWGTNPMVVASAQTLRSDHKERRKRLLEAPSWDLVVADEAHHMNNDAKSGATLAWELIEQLQDRRRIASMVFFTGTPHRGKDFGFLSLLKLLKPEMFDPKRPMEDQLGALSEVMIRNNKRRVTDMRGRPIFQPVSVGTETYGYSPAEAAFYTLLTDYISSGRAYASSLAAQEQRMAILVLIAMQKLASSSVAAIRRALAGRLDRIKRAATKGAEEVARLRRELEEMDVEDNPADADRRAAIEEEIAARGLDVTLGPHEIPAIQELLAAAAQITQETKIERIVELVTSKFAGRSVLFFTEYKATQAALMSALRARFGDDCVAFINGDGRIEGVRTQDGGEEVLTSSREDVARRFNGAEVPYLVSTEAAGEGIDLQRSCHTLIHVDLPWNPMRLHQRVGRIDRYGQTKPVEVLSLRNPDTVEARIWDCLNAKLDRISLAFGAAMDDPEDMLQLVLGMSRAADFERLFLEAPRDAGRGELARWFDAETATFGGKRAIDVVRDLVGNVARFDFGSEAAGLPQVDLPDLLPFFRGSLTLAGRKVEEADGAVSFRTPDPWVKADFALADRYEGLSFRRGKPGGAAQDVGGVGHRVFNAAIGAAEAERDVLGFLPGLAQPLAVFAVRDAVTTGGNVVQRTIAGVEGVPGEFALVHDWQVVLRLNPCVTRSLARSRPPGNDVQPFASSAVDHVRAAGAWLEARLGDLGLPFQQPRLDPLVLLAPPQPGPDDGPGDRQLPPSASPGK